MHTNFNTARWLRSWAPCSEGRGAGSEGSELPARSRLLVLILTGYHRLVSPFLPAACRFYPTCSIYAAEAVAHHGARRGLWLGLRRIARCHPLTAGGYDPVPGVPSRAVETVPPVGRG